MAPFCALLNMTLKILDATIFYHSYYLRKPVYFNSSLVDYKKFLYVYNDEYNFTEKIFIMVNDVLIGREEELEEIIYI